MIAELGQIAEEESLTWENDTLKRTVTKLLTLEKKATYGIVRGKNTLMSKIIDSEFNNYMDELNEN